MNNLLSNYSYLEYLILILLASILGLSIRYTLGYSKQSWVMTAHHTLTYCLLPTVTMIITTLISGNLALSLGMIGALSIVRFRNPVKSPLELVLFFALITIGIGCAVNFKLSILLSLMINIFILSFFKIDNYFLKNKNKSIFTLSFEEGLNYNSIDIISKEELKELGKHKKLRQFYLDNTSKNFNYKIESKSRQEIDNLNEILKKDPNIININIYYAR
tara:strand:+ start:707 stop:1360 length:654 start_codon:yes stop_codon:yes gene_type:complete